METEYHENEGDEVSAIDAWKVTKRAMDANGLTVHNLGDDIWEVADQMLAAIAELEARVEALSERRLPCREAEVAQARYEKAEAENERRNMITIDTSEMQKRFINETRQKFADAGYDLSIDEVDILVTKLPASLYETLFCRILQPMHGMEPIR